MKSVGLYDSVVPPPRVHSIVVMVIPPSVTALYYMCISDGTPVWRHLLGLWVQEQGVTLIQEPKGSHGIRIIASQSTTHGHANFCDGISCPSVCSSICLSVGCSGLTPCTCCDATAQCLFVQRNRLASTTSTRGFQPLTGDQNIIIMVRTFNAIAVLLYSI